MTVLAIKKCKSVGGLLEKLYLCMKIYKYDDIPNFYNSSFWKYCSYL